MNKYLKIPFVVLLMFLALFISVGCDKDDNPDEKTYDLNYIVEHLKVDNFTALEYKKVINSNEIMLYQESLNVTLVNSKYTIIKSTKELDINSESGYKEETTTNESSSYNGEITLMLNSESLEEVEILEFSLKANVKDEKALDVLKISDAKDISIEITLNNDLKVSEIKISYTDESSGFKVDLSTKYHY